MSVSAAISNTTNATSKKTSEERESMIVLNDKIIFLKLFINNFIGSS